MTHIFEVGSFMYNAIASGGQMYDILNFGRSVTIGDVVIYQRLADSEDESDGNGEINDTPYTEDECSVIISHIFSDDEKALKKGFIAVGYTQNQRHQN